MKNNTIEELVSELKTIGTEMRKWEEKGKSPEIKEPIDRLYEAALQVETAWSGSNIGYHSRVYYKDFIVPPPGAHFSSEWGLYESYSGGTRGNWVEYKYDDVVQYIEHLAGDPDLTPAREGSEQARKMFEEAKAAVTSIISAFIAERTDNFITSLKEEVEKIPIFTTYDAIRAQMPTGQIGSRDSLAMSQGVRSAPHQGINGELFAIRSAFTACNDLGKIARRAAAHIDRLTIAKSAKRPQGESVFIGHGRSLLWRELKDFIQVRLRLSWEEFNRVPVAGVTNIARLSEMLDASSIAFLILTAEDEQKDGEMVARQNVVHEAGLFQGRLGFTRAIILLEEGCKEFSNIQGLGQIRFPKGSIGAAFEEVRLVLEREGFIDT